MALIDRALDQVARVLTHAQRLEEGSIEFFLCVLAICETIHQLCAPARFTVTARVPPLWRAATSAHGRNNGHAQHPKAAGAMSQVRVRPSRRTTVTARFIAPAIQALFARLIAGRLADNTVPNRACDCGGEEQHHSIPSNSWSWLGWPACRQCGIHVPAAGRGHTPLLVSRYHSSRNCPGSSPGRARFGSDAKPRVRAQTCA